MVKLLNIEELMKVSGGNPIRLPIGTSPFDPK